MCCQSYLCLLDIVDLTLFIVKCGITRFLCAMRVFDIGHHPHHEATLLSNFVSFAASIAELAHGEKSRNQSTSHSLTH